jgi:hypothetical protein
MVALRVLPAPSNELARFLQALEEAALIPSQP